MSSLSRLAVILASRLVSSLAPPKSTTTYVYREWTKPQAKAKINYDSKNQAIGKSKVGRQSMMFKF